MPVPAEICPAFEQVWGLPVRVWCPAVGPHRPRRHRIGSVEWDKAVQ